ncbi:hypothetical protein EDB84DRAFT_1268581, partial [Lactarius hengduanensis]
APTATFAHSDAITIAELVIYPAVDPLVSKSRILDPTLYQVSRLLPLLSRSIAELVIYPAVDPLDPQSRSNDRKANWTTHVGHGG